MKVELGCKQIQLIHPVWLRSGFLYRVRHIFGACPAFCHYYSNSASRCFPRCFPVLPGASRSSRRASRWRGGAACFIRRRMRRMQPWRIVPRRSMRGGRTGPADRAGFLKYINSTIVNLSRIIIVLEYCTGQPIPNEPKFWSAPPLFLEDENFFQKSGSMVVILFQFRLQPWRPIFELHL